jgi:tetratricopeptide (TPR) repeat protein
MGESLEKNLMSNEMWHTKAHAGRMALEQGKLTDAEHLLRDAIESARKVGAHDEHYTHALNNLGMVLMHEGELDDADKLFEEALSLSEVHKDAIEKAIILNNLATSYQAQERYSEAEKMFKQNLEYSEKKWGARHSSVGLCQNNLGVLYLESGNYAAAEEYLSKALDTRENNGQAATAVAESLFNLAILYSKQDRPDEMKKTITKALPLLHMALGPDSPELLAILEDTLALAEALDEDVVADHLSEEIEHMKLRQRS